MTSDNTRELIAEAEEWAERALPPSPWGEKHVVHRLVKALAALTTPQEPEWEYGTALVADPSDATAHADRLSAGKAVAGWNESVRRMDRLGARNSGPAMIVRRRKAGPWLPVGGENDDR